MKFTGILVVAVLVLIHGSAQAAWIIDKSGLNIAPPPSPGSAGDQKDFQILFQYQEKRTDDDCRAADLQTVPSLASLFGPQTGALTEDEIAAVDEFAGEVADTVSKAVSPFKKHWVRQRPYDENADISPCIRKPGGQTSYPSTHAALGVVLGDLLAQIFPAKSISLHEAGKRVGENRVLGGVHHPSDVVAGQRLGAQIESALMQNPDFTSALSALKH